MNCPKYKLLPWIIKDRLNKFGLRKNSKLIHVIKEFDIEFHSYMSANAETFKGIKIDWRQLSQNPSSGAIRILKNNKDKIEWNFLSGNSNPEAVNLLKQNPDKINWKFLSTNTNPDAISILENNLDKIHWDCLSENPSAIRIIKNNIDKISWYALSGNPNSDAVRILENNPEKIDWSSLSENPNAIHLIEEMLKTEKAYLINWNLLAKNPKAIHILESRLISPETGWNGIKDETECDNFYWFYLSSNPSIFTFDYIKMKKDFSFLKKEIVEKAMNPKRIERILSMVNPNTGNPYTTEDIDNII
jgi:hypothetical protein